MTWAATFGRVLTWDDMAWLRSLTTLPIILQGICHPEDARHPIDAGADAIFCSNHGGRQAHGGIAAIAILPDVVAAVGDEIGGPSCRESGCQDVDLLVRTV